MHDEKLRETLERNAKAYSRFDAATRDGAHEDYLASIAPWRAGMGYDVPGEFVVEVGIRGGRGSDDEQRR
jgi:hypothetical protein